MPKACRPSSIVSGAVAERIKLGSFLVYAIVLVTFIYPITGSWQWGGGWLSSLGIGGEVDGEPIGFWERGCKALEPGDIVVEIVPTDASEHEPAG